MARFFVVGVRFIYAFYRLFALKKYDLTRQHTKRYIGHVSEYARHSPLVKH